MTLGELRKALARYLGLASTVQDGLVAYHETEALNSAMRREGLDLGLPRLTASVPIDDNNLGVTSGLAYQIDVPLSASYTTPSDEERQLPIVYLEGLDLNGPKPHAVWSFATGALKIEPIETEPITGIELTYIPVYPDMRNANDEPWLGQFKRFHELIALSAAVDLATQLVGEGTDTLQPRIATLQRSYQMYRNTLIDLIGHGPIRPTVPMKVVRRY